MSKYAKIKDVLELKWFMIQEIIKLSTLIFPFKALHDQQFPKHIQLQQKRTNVRVFRNNMEI